MFREWWKILLILMFFIIRFATASAQEGGSYVVTSSQSINARTCSRLTCDVARTFAPGDVLVVESQVEGDTVSGSDQWLQLNEDGSDVFVHSSLAAPVPEMEKTTETEGVLTTETTELETVSTSRWVEHQAHSATITTPRNWMTFEAFLADEELIESIAEMSDLEPDELIAMFEQEIGVEVVEAADLILIEPFSSVFLVALHIDMDGAELGVNFLKRAMMSQIEGMGGEVLSDEIIHVPAGNGVRVHFHVVDDGSDSAATTEMLFYAIVDSQHTYLLMCGTLSDSFKQMEPVFDTIVQEFQPEPPNL
jgi:hypothetical protein